MAVRGSDVRFLTPVLRRPVEPAGPERTCPDHLAMSPFDPNRTFDIEIEVIE
jgi:hypothetical protein